MKRLITLAAAGTVSAQLLIASPAYALMFQNPIEASRARCDAVAGREKLRCEFINNRVERLRFRQIRNTYERGSTMREQRVLRRQQNYGENTIRRVRGYDMSRLRTHNRDGGNARRLINMRDEQARKACRSAEPTERSQCIREQWRALRRGNTR